MKKRISLIVNVIELYCIARREIKSSPVTEFAVASHLNTANSRVEVGEKKQLSFRRKYAMITMFIQECEDDQDDPYDHIYYYLCIPVGGNPTAGGQIGRSVRFHRRYG